MVFKNGELLRFYYDVRQDLSTLSNSEVNINFSEAADRNGANPDACGSTIEGPTTINGGEVLEFCELDIRINLNTAYTVIISKIDELGIQHVLMTIAGATANSIHVDKNDFESRIDRTIPSGLRDGITWQVGDCLVNITTDDDSDLENALYLSWVVRAH